jgi:hypothetical protein
MILDFDGGDKMVKKVQHITEQQADALLKLSKVSKSFWFYVKFWQIVFLVIMLGLILIFLALLKMAWTYVFMW